MNSFCDMLPYNLRNDFLEHVFVNASLNNSLLSNSIDTIKIFLKDMVPLLHKPDDIIILEGDKAAYFFILAIGECYTVHSNL